MLLLAALALNYFHFYMTSWDTFTLDPAAHAQYVIYIAKHNALPPMDDNPAARHPATYYMLAAGLYKLGLAEGDTQPLLIVRHLSMALFMVFTLFSTQWLRSFLRPPQTSYYAALALLLFWPLGVIMGARITCDLLLYAGQAGVLYMLVRLLQTRSLHYLRNAFIAAGICLLAKNTGMVMVLITAGVLLCEAYERRKAWRSLLRTDLLLSILFVAACYWITSMRGWVTEAEKITGPAYDFYYWLRSFLSFNPYLFITDIATGDSHGMFWNMLLHSLLLGDTLPWKTSIILECFNTCWLVIMGYMLEGMFHRSRATRKSYSNVFKSDEATSKLMMAYIVLTLAAMMFMSVKTGNLLYADGRYLYPAVPIIALAYGKTVEYNLSAQRTIAYNVGLGLALIFVALTFMLFASQQLE